MQNHSIHRTQLIYARLAGIMYLLITVMFSFATLRLYTDAQLLSAFQGSHLPMGIAEVGTALWLTIAGIRPRQLAAADTGAA